MGQGLERSGCTGVLWRQLRAKLPQIAIAALTYAVRRYMASKRV